MFFFFLFFPFVLIYFNQIGKISNLVLFSCTRGAIDDLLFLCRFALFITKILILFYFAILREIMFLARVCDICWDLDMMVICEVWILNTVLLLTCSMIWCIHLQLGFIFCIYILYFCLTFYISVLYFILMFHYMSLRFVFHFCFSLHLFLNNPIVFW